MWSQTYDVDGFQKIKAADFFWKPAALFLLIAILDFYIDVKLQDRMHTQMQNLRNSISSIVIEIGIDISRFDGHLFRQ